MALAFDNVEDDGALEWRKILEQGWAKAEEAQDSAATLAAPEPETGDVDEEGAADMEVSTSDDASSLLVAVKERLTEARQSAKYHDFLMAISSATVDSEAALAILAGHDDLIAAFEKCFIPAAPTTEVEPDFMDMDETTERKGPQARASQMVNLVWANKAGHLGERAKMLEYVKARIKQPAFPKRLYLLRGTAGAGGAAWAMESLRKEVDVRGSSLAAQLAHVCSIDDFFTSFAGAGSAQMKYAADPKKLAANCIANEARVRLAMEAGLEPLYVANPFMLLWDMQAYVLLADRFGYQVTVVAPEEICPAWNDIEFLTSRSEEKLSRAALETTIASFESLPTDADPRPLIRTAQKPDGASQKVDGVSKVLKAPALLYKLEKLMLEGSNLTRYAPIVGRGWGVNGELDGEQHSFRESAAGMCSYEDGIHWQGEDQEAWTFEAITWLDDLRIQAFQLPEQAAPTMDSFPEVSEDVAEEEAEDAPPAPQAPPEKPPAKKATPKVVAEAAPAAPRSVPTSRKERFKQRALHPQVEAPVPEEKPEEEVEEPPPAAPPPKRPRVDPSVARKPKPASQSFVDADAYVPPAGMPSEAEEMSAATFLAAVKARLSDWGKIDLYHEFVIALSGSVDAKAAVRILRGHDDLLRVFRQKFAPKADLLQIKAEIDQDDSSIPHAPPMPPPGRAPVKQELGRVKAESGRVKSELGAVKKELGKAVKTELLGSSIPHPPSYKPGTHRVVSVGDDSDEDDVMDDVSIALAVKKGKDECIACLAKCLFRKERASREGVRQRFDMVRYATRRAAKPRFPRELFVLRGPPGIGKTDYAMAQLNEHVDIEPGEELGAQLTHICATDDFFEMFKGDNPEYKYDAKKLENHQLRNQARVRLAMEAGIHPIYIDEPNLRLFEMRPYLALAERLGYVVTVVEPHEISDKWSDVEFLASANDTVLRSEVGKVVSRELLQAMLDAYEVLPSDQDPTDVIRAAKQGDSPSVIEVASSSSRPPRPSGPAKNGSKIPAYKGVKTEIGKRTR